MKHLAVAAVAIICATPALAVNYFHVNNECHHPIDIVVRYEHAPEDWRTSGWYTVNAGEKVYLLATREDLLESSNSIFYYYAKVRGRSEQWAGGGSVKDRTYVVDGHRLRFRRVDDRFWNNDVVLVCPKIDPPSRISGTLAGFLEVAAQRAAAGRNEAANALLAKMRPKVEFRNGLIGLAGGGMGGGGAMVVDDPCGPYGLSQVECEIVRDTGSAERLKDRAAAWLGWGAGVGCGAAVASTGIGLPVAIPVGLACKILVGSATRTVFNCAVGPAERRMMRTLTGRDINEGCLEIDLSIGLGF